jgi:hypothetical protein
VRQFAARRSAGEPHVKKTLAPVEANRLMLDGGAAVPMFRQGPPGLGAGADVGSQPR